MGARQDAMFAPGCGARAAGGCFPAGLPRRARPPALLLQPPGRQSRPARFRQAMRHGCRRHASRDRPGLDAPVAHPPRASPVARDGPARSGGNPSRSVGSHASGGACRRCCGPIPIPWREHRARPPGGRCASAATRQGRPGGAAAPRSAAVRCGGAKAGPSCTGGRIHAVVRRHGWPGCSGHWPIPRSRSRALTRSSGRASTVWPLPVVVVAWRSAL